MPLFYRTVTISSSSSSFSSSVSSSIFRAVCVACVCGSSSFFSSSFWRRSWRKRKFKKNSKVVKLWVKLPFWSVGSQRWCSRRHRSPRLTWQRTASCARTTPCCKRRQWRIRETPRVDSWKRRLPCFFGKVFHKVRWFEFATRRHLKIFCFQNLFKLKGVSAFLPTPQRPEIKKKIKGLSGCGRQNRR